MTVWLKDNSLKLIAEFNSECFVVVNSVQNVNSIVDKENVNDDENEGEDQNIIGQIVSS